MYLAHHELDSVFVIVVMLNRQSPEDKGYAQPCAHAPCAQRAHSPLHAWLNVQNTQGKFANADAYLQCYARTP